MDSTKAMESKQTKQVIFKLGKEEYGLDIMLVNAIEKFVDLVTIPNAPTFIRGIINLRGDVIPVYSLRRKFGLEDKEIDESTKLIIIKSRGILMAYEVDEVKEILEIPCDKISATPEIVKSKQTAYIKSVANIDGRMLVLLDHDGVLSDREKDSIEAFITQ